jgi:2-oxoisovalerate dehydrogenase E2 component (dihydrolipoyl transacylase)
MRIFYLPDLGEGLPDAEIHEWLIKEGDEVQVDQPIVSMETAKALVDVPSPYNGQIAKLHGHPGDIIKTGAPLVSFTPPSEPSVNDTKETKQEKESATVVGRIEARDQVIQESPTGIIPHKNKHPIKVTPAVRALAKQLHVVLEDVIPTGPAGSITFQDVKFAEEKSNALAEGFETLQGVRRTMAVNMAQAHATVVPVTLVDDADVQHFKPNEDITLRVIRAIIAACKLEPGLNAHFNAKNMSRRLFSDINIGLAIDTAKGLYVPVIKHSQALSNEKLREGINQFKQQAKQEDFSKENFQDATIMLSNFGIFVGRYANPIVMPPTVAIIGIGKLRDEVVPVSGQPQIHRIMPISLTFDHRALTGGEAARFLATFITDLESC